MPGQPANVSVAYFEEGDVSFRATAAVTGKRFIAPSGDVTGGPGLSTDFENVYRCAHAGSGVKPCGVSQYDVAIGSRGPQHGNPGKIVPVTAGAALTAGQEVQSDATGQAIPLAAGRPAGLCMSGASNGADAQIKLYA
jgi:hypothetical protein